MWSVSGMTKSDFLFFIMGKSRHLRQLPVSVLKQNDHPDDARIKAESIGPIKTEIYHVVYEWDDKM